MVLSDEMREVGRRAISIALSQGHEVVEVPQLVAALPGRQMTSLSSAAG